MVKYICRRRLKEGHGWLMPGDEFPVKPYHNLKGLIGMGWIEQVADGQELPARPSAPKAATKPVKTMPDDIEALSKAELIELVGDLGIEDIQGTGSNGFIMKSDLQAAIKAYQDNA